MTDQNKKKTIASYNRVAKDFGDSQDENFWTKELEEFKKLLGSKRKVIDIGCGTARDAQFFIDAGFDYTGIDLAENMIDYAKERFPRASFVVMDFENLDFPASSFDGFWSTAALLHLPKAKFGQVLKDIARIVKPAGKGFISLKPKTNNTEEALVPDNRYGGMERFFAYYNEAELEERLNQNDWKILKSYRNHYQLKDGLRTWICLFIERK